MTEPEETKYWPGTYLYRCVNVELKEDDEVPSEWRIVRYSFRVIFVLKWLSLLYNLVQVVMAGFLVPINKDFLGFNPTYKDNWYADIIQSLRYINYTYAFTNVRCEDAIKKLELCGYKCNAKNIIVSFVVKFFYLNWLCNILLLAGDPHLHQPITPTFAELLEWKTPLIAAVGVITGYYSISGRVYMDTMLVPSTTKDKLILTAVDLSTNWLVFFMVPLVNTFMGLMQLCSLPFMCVACCFQCATTALAKIAQASRDVFVVLMWLNGMGIPVNPQPASTDYMSLNS